MEWKQNKRWQVSFFVCVCVCVPRPNRGTYEIYKENPSPTETDAAGKLNIGTNVMHLLVVRCFAAFVGEKRQDNQPKSTSLAGNGQTWPNSWIMNVMQLLVSSHIWMFESLWGEARQNNQPKSKFHEFVMNKTHGSSSYDKFLLQRFVAPVDRKAPDRDKT